MCIRQKHWDREILKQFISIAMLRPDEIKIINCSIKGYTNKKIAEILKVSESTVNRKIKVLKQKYDRLIEKGYKLPKREEW